MVLQNEVYPFFLGELPITVKKSFPIIGKPFLFLLGAFVTRKKGHGIFKFKLFFTIVNQ